jgi:hypothetical protein
MKRQSPLEPLTEQGTVTLGRAMATEIMALKQIGAIAKPT